MRKVLVARYLFCKLDRYKDTQDGLLKQESLDKPNKREHDVKCKVIPAKVIFR